MGYRKLVTILILTKLFLFSLNLSSNNNINLQLISNQNNISSQPTDVNESWHTAISSDSLIEMFYETKLTNNPTFELPHRVIYPSQTIFREYILPTLNSEKLCQLYTFANSKNPSIAPQNFFPAERFFKSHTVLFEHKILYHFKVEAPTQFSQFKPILYNPTDKTMRAISSSEFLNFENISEGCIIASFGQYLSLFRPELNTKPFDDENKTVMIATETNSRKFILILEDKNLKQHSLICHGNYRGEGRTRGSISLYETPKYGNEIENIEYPRDINLILKAKYMSGIQKRFFKFQYGHIRTSQVLLPIWFSLINRLNHLRERVLLKLHPTRNYARLTIFERIFEDFIGILCLIFQAYIWMAPYKALMAAVFSPLYVNYSLKTFFLAWNLEPLTAAFFWGPTIVYQDLQLSETHFKIYPLNQMFVIPTLKIPLCKIFKEFMFAWLIMIALTSFVYSFVFEKNILVIVFMWEDYLFS